MTRSQHFKFNLPPTPQLYITIAMKTGKEVAQIAQAKQMYASMHLNTTARLKLTKTELSSYELLWGQWRTRTPPIHLRLLSTREDTNGGAPPTQYGMGEAPHHCPRVASNLYMLTCDISMTHHNTQATQQKRARAFTVSRH